MNDPKQLFKLTGKVQHYQWGGFSFLPKLLNISNETKKPFAEYWLGAHQNAPASLDGESEVLDHYLQHYPALLGEKVEARFGRLPYLLKVLDVKDMLSIQVHPSKEAAMLEFKRENEAGIPATAADRNYKDDNHKPELMLALSDFWLLHGFKVESSLWEYISQVKEFDFMKPLFEKGGYELLYRTLMEMPQAQVNSILDPLIDRLLPLYKKNELPMDEPAFWAARAALTYNREGIADRGIFSIYLLNLVHLDAGEAIFQDAGVLHAYLEGQNMEIMANSDNVLRGGLTPKHIDVQELIKHVDFKPLVPNIIHGKKVSDFEEVYLTPAPDFQLSRLSVAAGVETSVTCTSAEVFFVSEGVVLVEDTNNEQVNLMKGEAAIAFAGATVILNGQENAIIFRASVPSPVHS